MSGEDHEDEPGQPASYEVGYGKPPKAPRFKKGHSGNPGGRSKQRKGGDYFDEMLERKHAIDQNGRRRVLTGKEAFLEKLYIDAVKGDATARRLIMREIEQREAKAKKVLPSKIKAKLILEEEPPLPIREAIDQLADLEMQGSATAEELRDIREALVSYHRGYYPGWSPRSLN